MTGVGADSILKATNFKFQAIKLTGSGSEISNIKLTTNPTTYREVTDESSRIYVRDASNFVITNVIVDDSSSAGIFISNSKSGTVTGCTVKNTRADSIHVTNKSSYITIEHNRIRNGGDDNVGVVSYTKDGGVTHHILVQYNDIANNYWGRGASAIGGEDITIQYNRIADSRFAGVMVATEAVYGIYPVKRITIRGNDIYRCGSTTDMGSHGGIHVYSHGNPCTDIEFIENNIYDSKYAGVFLNGDGDSIQSVTLNGNYFAGTYSGEGVHLDSTFRGFAVIIGNIFEDIYSYGLKSIASSDCSLDIRGNQFIDVNTSNVGTNDVINVDGKMNSIKIQNNTHTYAAEHSLQYFIRETVNASKRAFSGNNSPKQSFINGQEVQTNSICI
jgi:parallel beta-helix repeat protein